MAKMPQFPVPAGDDQFSSRERHKHDNPPEDTDEGAERWLDRQFDAIMYRAIRQESIWRARAEAARRRKR